MCYCIGWSSVCLCIGLFVGEAEIQETAVVEVRYHSGTDLSYYSRGKPQEVTPRIAKMGIKAISSYLSSRSRPNSQIRMNCQSRETKPDVCFGDVRQDTTVSRWCDNSYYWRLCSFINPLIIYLFTINLHRINGRPVIKGKTHTPNVSLNICYWAQSTHM